MDRLHEALRAGPQNGDTNVRGLCHGEEAKVPGATLCESLSSSVCIKRVQYS